MNDMERRKFEDSFQEAFKDAEVNPSENVWTNIELDLERADGDKMKRRLFFFKMLAAASVVFAMSIAGIGYYVFQTSDSGDVAQTSENFRGIAEQDQTKNELNSSSSKNDNAVSSVEKSDADASDKVDSADKSSKPIADESQRAKSELPGSATLNENKRSSVTAAKSTQDRSNKNPEARSQQNGSIAKSTAPLLASDKNLNHSTPDVAQTTAETDDRNKTANATVRELPVFYQPAEPELQLPVSTADPGMLLLAKLAAEEKKYAAEEKKQTKNKPENLWTSVGFSAGGFNANNPSVAPVPANAMYNMNSATTATKQSKASGLAYSVGVSVGTNLSNRWVIQGGINYLTQTYDYTANSVVVVDNNFAAPKAESINAFAPQLADARADTKVAQTYPYNVNNSVRFVSVPLQAGYLVVNKKFGLQLNAGISTDLFLQNTITPDGGGLSQTTQGRGDESPYRSLNFSGLMGTEFSYRLGYRYRLSLNPGLRYPFSSVYKSTTGVESTPVTFDVGLRFRYIFH
jgi:hypothetical protein